MGKKTWRLSLGVTPAAALPATTLILLPHLTDGLVFGEFWGWGIAFLAVYGLNSGLDLLVALTGECARPSLRSAVWLQMRWLLIGVVVNIVLVALLPCLSGLFGLATSTGGASTVLPVGAILGVGFYLGSLITDVSFFVERRASGDGTEDDPPRGVPADN